MTVKMYVLTKDNKYLNQDIYSNYYMSNILNCFTLWFKSKEEALYTLQKVNKELRVKEFNCVLV